MRKTVAIILQKTDQPQEEMAGGGIYYTLGFWLGSPKEQRPACGASGLLKGKQAGKHKGRFSTDDWRVGRHDGLLGEYDHFRLHKADSYTKQGYANEQMSCYILNYIVRSSVTQE